MKKYLSVLGLMARSSIFKVIGTFVLMAISEFILFYHRFNYELRLYNMEFSMENLETIIDRSMIHWILAFGIAIITLSLCITGSEDSNTRTSYTIRRLSISEREFFFCQVTYNTFIYIMFWAVQTIIVFGLCMWYNTFAPEEAVGNQTVFLAFYRNRLLHGLLPLSEISLWIRNIFIVIGLGFATAEFPYKQRRHKNSVTIIAYLLYVLIYFSQSVGASFNVFLVILVTLCIIAETLYTVFKKDEEEVLTNENN